MNKHFSICCLSLVNFKKSQIIVWATLLVVFLRRGFTNLFTLWWKLLGSPCYVYHDLELGFFLNSPNKCQCSVLFSGIGIGSCTHPWTIHNGQGNAVLWLVTLECPHPTPRISEGIDSHSPSVRVEKVDHPEVSWGNFPTGFLFRLVIPQGEALTSQAKNQNLQCLPTS